MWISKRVLFAIIAAAAGAIGLWSAVVAQGHDDGGDSSGHQALVAGLAPSQPGDPTLHGVTPGGAPWILARDEVRLERRGRFELRVRGLVIPTAPGNGTPGPVNTISASLYCGADAVGTPIDTTGQAPLSRHGDARIRDRSFTVPARCLAPIVLVHPNGDTTRYIAATGWERG